MDNDAIAVLDENARLELLQINLSRQFVLSPSDNAVYRLAFFLFEAPRVLKTKRR